MPQPPRVRLPSARCGRRTRLTAVVGYNHHRAILFVRHGDHHAHDRLTSVRIQRRGRLIGEQNLGRTGDCGRNRHTLLLAAADVAWKRVVSLPKPDLLQQTSRLVLCLPGRCTPFSFRLSSIPIKVDTDVNKISKLKIILS